jgi:hypothetical protein
MPNTVADAFEHLAASASGAMRRRDALEERP